MYIILYFQDQNFLSKYIFHTYLGKIFQKTGSFMQKKSTVAEIWQRKYPEQYQDRDYDIRVDIGSIDA